MKGLYTSTVNTKDYLSELKLLAHRLQERHKTDLEKLEEPVLLLVELPQNGLAHFLIGPEGIHYMETPPSLENKVIISYKDLLRLIEKPTKVIRYIFEGKIKFHGDSRKILGALQKLL